MHAGFLCCSFLLPAKRKLDRESLWRFDASGVQISSSALCGARRAPLYKTRDSPRIVWVRRAERPLSIARFEVASDWWLVKAWASPKLFLTHAATRTTKRTSLYSYRTYAQLRARSNTQAIRASCSGALYTRSTFPYGRNPNKCTGNSLCSPQVYILFASFA